MRPQIPSPAMIQHVTHAIRPTEVEACIEFYRILGFQPVHTPPGITGRARWLESADGPRARSQVHLQLADDPRPGSGHFAVVCADYEDTIERLHNAGHDVDHRRRHWGSPRAYVRDPGGNLVELMAWPPGDSAGRRE